MTTVRTNPLAIASYESSVEARAVLARLGEQIVADAQAACPRDSGALAESIGHEVGTDSDGAYVRVSWSEERFYGQFVELGTSQMSPRPFLRPAAQKKRNL